MLKCILESSSFRLNVAIISIDDVYLTRNERLDLASSIHPLCASRGVPGTHDVQLAHRTLDALCDAETPTAFIPRFDKSKDDRCPQSAFDVFRGVPDVIFFEGWCVGAASPSREDAWSGPTNAREKLQDPDGVWAKWSDAALASDAYQSLFGRIDKLVMIKVPSSMDTVIDSRWKQECNLIDRLKQTGLDTSKCFQSRDDVAEFVALYERHTKRMWEEMPTRADVLIERDAAFAQTISRMPNYVSSISNVNNF